MEYEINSTLNFGKYKGLTIQQIYQGTLKIDKFVVRDYLNSILNAENFRDWAFFDNNELIDRFDLSNNLIELIGEIADNELPKGKKNRVLFGNIEKDLTNFINQHFKPSFLGVLPDISSFNDKNNLPTIVGGSPEYLQWCEANIEDFSLSSKCKSSLNKIGFSKLIGFQLMYIGNEKYEYSPKFDVITK